MATGGNVNASDEIINVKCCVCAGKNIKREADKYCVECQDYFCIPCTDTHKTIPPLRGHKLLDKADFNTTGQGSNLPLFPTERCAIHKSKLVDMYCENHDEAICATCVALHHRTCSNMHSVPDGIEQLYKIEVTDDMKTKLKTTLETMTELTKTKKSQVIELKTYMASAREAIKIFRQEIEEIIQQIEQNTILLLEAKCGKQETKLREEIKDANLYINRLESSTEKLKVSEGNKAQEFVIVKSSTNVINEAKRIATGLDKTENGEMTFEADKEILKFLKQLDVFGKVATKKEPGTMVYTVKQVREVDIQLQDDKGVCSIHGSCLTEDGWLLLSDRTNMKLKRVDLGKEKVKDCLKLNNKPNSVCPVSSCEAAVTLSDNTIQFVSLANEMKETRKITFNHKCYGIACKDGKLFISNYLDAVHIYEINGAMIQKITTDSSLKPLFSFALHIVLDTSVDRVYIADRDNGLIILDPKGNHISTFTDSEFKKARDMCLDGNGNMFVCGWKSTGIMHIKQGSMKKLGVFGTVGYPLSLCFDQHRNRLILTECNENKIKIFELE